MIEYRPVPEAREEEFREMLSYAFNPEGGPRSFEPDEEPPAPAQIGENRGLFDVAEAGTRGDDTPGTEAALLVACRHIHLAATLRGEPVEVVGITGVSSPPEHRRRGLVRRLMADSLAECRDRGIPLSALWPFKYSFYRRLGWAVSNTYATQEFPVDAIAFAREDRPEAGEFVRLEADDWARLSAVRAAHGAGYELTVDRTEEWWRKRVFSGWDTDPYVYGYERDGDLRGYLVYRISSGDDGRTLRAWDAAFVDHAARLALLGFIADHDSQVSRVFLYGPPDETLLDLVPEPDEVDLAVKAGPMVRLVDVAPALEAHPYPDADGDVVLEVSDPLCDWNEGRFAVTVSGGEATVAETDDDPDAVLDVGTLSQLSVGYRAVDDLATTGELSAATPGAIDHLDRLFPPRNPFLREGF